MALARRDRNASWDVLLSIGGFLFCSGQLLEEYSGLAILKQRGSMNFLENDRLYRTALGGMKPTNLRKEM